MTAVLRQWLTFAWPPVLERERHTSRSAPFLIFAFLPVLLASYLRLRHPGLPFLSRLIVLIVGMSITSHLFLKRYFATTWYDPVTGIPYSLIYHNLNCAMALSSFGLKMVELLLCTGNESDYDVQDWQEYSKSQGAEKDSTTKSGEKYTLQRPAYYPGTSVPLALDLGLTVRGQGYGHAATGSMGGYRAILESEQLAKGTPTSAKQQKWSHLRRIGLSVLSSYVLMDMANSLIRDPRVFPPASRMGGGPLSEAVKGYFGSLGPIIVAVCTGVLVFVGLQVGYGVAYLTVLLITPANKVPIVVGKWDPMPCYRPYAATSLSSFWSKHWHGLMRRGFLLVSYNPVLRLSSKVGLPGRVGKFIALVASFALSGLIHEICLEAQQSAFYDKRPNNGHINIRGASAEVQRQFGFGAKQFATTYAFTVQALFITIEQVWVDSVELWVTHLTTGRKGKLVQGRLRLILGWLWTYSCMTYSGLYIVDLWHSHGLINANTATHICLTIFKRLRDGVWV